MSDMNPQVNLTNATDSRNNQIATAASNLTINVHNDRLTSGRKESLELDAEEAADSMSGLEVSKQRQIELEEKKLKAARHPCSEYSNLIQKRMTQREQKYFDSGDYNLAISSGASAGGGIGGGGDSGDSSSCIGGSSGVGGGISGSTGGGIIGSASGSIIGSTGSVINSGSIVEERVKVDRKRFEQMLGENSNFGCDADSFFRRVMRSTNTQIMWPPKLKPGTKSKKDPHVRITGSPNSINAAKEIIFEQLDTRRNRVTLKMDVAFTDHSHIIGKGGRSIQRVMDETGCHIHFPDSNRTNTAEKSNQVSIAGSAEGVEQSRCRIREMLPINLQFDLPLNNGLHSPPTLDPQSPQLQAIQQTYGITISFKCDGSKCSNNSYFASSRIITVAVRGARSHLFGLRQGLSVLIEYLTGFRANTINVPLTMTLDVAVQHHSFIAGRANCNIRAIMQSTGVVITMPDNLATQIPPNGIPGQLGSGAMSSIASSLSSIAGAVSGASSSSSATLSSPTNAQVSVGSQATSAVSASETPSVTTATTSSSFSDLTSLCGQQLSSSSTSFMTALTNQNFHHGSNPNLASNAPAVSLAGAATSNNNRKTAIVIKGPNFESVYGAWQELLGYLPLILIFDLKEGQDLDPVQVTKLMEQMRQISILIKPKQRQNTKSIVVRGPEKDSRLLFEVRKQILKSDDSELQAYSAPDGQHKQQQQPQQLQQSQPNAQQHPQNQQTTSQQLTSITQQRPTSSQINDPEMQLKAIRAILEPNLEKTRHPTPYWAGLGFSKSVSEPMVKEKLSMGPLFSSNIAEERRISYSNEGVIQDLANSLQSLSSGQMSTSGKFFTNFVNDNNNNTTNSGSTNMSNSTACNNHNNNHGYVGQNNKQCVGTGVAHADSNNNSTISHKQPQQGSNMGENYNIKSEPNHVTSTIMDINNNLTKLSSNSMHNIGATNNSMSSCNTGRLVSGHSSVSSPTNHPNVGSNQKISSCLRLAMFLGRIGLVQYLGLLTQHGIDLEMLFTLNESDFAELGLPFVHRRKLSIAIAEVKSSIQNERAALSSLASTFDAAPGAERSRRQKARCSTRGNELNEAWPM